MSLNYLKYVAQRILGLECREKFGRVFVFTGSRGGDKNCRTSSLMVPRAFFPSRLNNSQFLSLNTRRLAILNYIKFVDRWIFRL